MMRSEHCLLLPTARLERSSPQSHLDGNSAQRIPSPGKTLSGDS